MWKKLKAAQIGAFGLAGLQAGTREQIDSALVLQAVRESESKALISRAENFEAIAKSLREESSDKLDEAARAAKWASKLEKTLA